MVRHSDAFTRTKSNNRIRTTANLLIARGGQPRKSQDSILSRLENYQAKIMLTVKTRNFQVVIDIAAIIRALAIVVVLLI